MRDYVILTDSGTDLTRQKAKEVDVTVLDLMVIKEGDPTPYPNSEVDVKEFYDFLRTKKTATTSAINSDTFCEAMEKIINEGKDVLYLGFSSGLSGTYNAAFVAAQELAEKYPERKVYTVDTLCASLGQGLFVYTAAKQRLEGKSIDELYEWAKDNRLSLCHWFTVDDLFFLKRGGRVSAATAVMGTMLSIKPVLHVDFKGKLINVSKARGRKAAVDALFDNAKRTAIEPEKQTMFISHGDCLNDAEYLAERLKKELGVPEVIIGYVGPVIGAHAGPGVLALFFFGTER